MRRFATAPRKALFTRRWASNKADLTDEKLLENINSQLGDAGRVDLGAQSVSTPSGDLPVSPIMNPAWIRARRRKRKDKQGPVNSRFQGKLRLNPYARALASPIRYCGLTQTYLPRFFLQDMEVVKHPETDEFWYVPGAEAIDSVQPVYHSGSEIKKGVTQEPGREEKDDGGVESRKTEIQAEGMASPRHPRAPVRFYVLGRKEILDPIDEKPAIKGMLMGSRSGTAYQQAMRGSNWRKGTGDLFLDTMRSTATAALITRANRTRQGQESRFLLPVSKWDDIVSVASRESVLWLPDEASAGDDAAAPSEYATFDLENVRYNRKMAVFNLPTLLGSTEVARLKTCAPEIFGQHQLVVLKRHPSHSMISLHMLLWRLQGYLRKTPE